MNKQWISMGGIALLYAAFWHWYTGAQRPLTGREVEHYLALLTDKGASADALARVGAFLKADTGRAFVMVNFLKLWEHPQSMPNGSLNAESSRELLQRYTLPFLRKLFTRAGHPVLAGESMGAALEAWGVPADEGWSDVGLVRYRSRRDMIEMATASEFVDIHPFKIAALEKTVAVPVEPRLNIGDPRLIIGLLAVIAALVLNRPRS